MITTSPLLAEANVPLLVKVADVARLLSISRQTVHHLIDCGDLQGSRINPCLKRRTHVRVTRASLLIFYKKRFGHSLDRALANAVEP